MEVNILFIAKYIYYLEQEDVLPRLLNLSLNFDYLVMSEYDYTIREQIDNLDISLRAFGNKGIYKKLDEAILNDPLKTKSILELVINRGIDTVRFCEEMNINNQNAQYFVPLIRAFVLNLAYQYKIDVSNLRKKRLPKSKNELEPPFRDKETKNLFQYIVEKWNNTNANKWGYIWNFLFDEGNGKLTSKGDYETYLRKHCDFVKGKPNYESCNNEQHKAEIERLCDEFKLK